MGSDTFPLGNYMLSFHCVPCHTLWETLKSLETYLRELSWGDSCEGRLFPCNLEVAFRSVTWAIHAVFFKVPQKIWFRKVEQHPFVLELTLIQQLDPKPVISWDVMQIQMLAMIPKWSRLCLHWTLAPDVHPHVQGWGLLPELHTSLSIPQWEETKSGGEWLLFRGGVGDEQQENWSVWDEICSFYTCSSESHAAVLCDSVHVPCCLLFGNNPTKGCLFTLVFKECPFFQQTPTYV